MACLSPVVAAGGRPKRRWWGRGSDATTGEGAGEDRRVAEEGRGPEEQGRGLATAGGAAAMSGRR